MINAFSNNELEVIEYGVQALQDLKKKTTDQGKEFPIDFNYYRDSMEAVVISRSENVTPLEAVLDLVSRVESRVNEWNGAIKTLR